MRARAVCGLHTEVVDHGEEAGQRRVGGWEEVRAEAGSRHERGADLGQFDVERVVVTVVVVVVLSNGVGG